jgi:hypothetical protein
VQLRSITELKHTGDETSQRTARIDLDADQGRTQKGAYRRRFGFEMILLSGTSL